MAGVTGIGFSTAFPGWSEGKGDGKMNNPLKVEDPTEAAFAAIQEALTLELENAQSDAGIERADMRPDAVDDAYEAAPPVPVAPILQERPVQPAGTRPIGRRAVRDDSIEERPARQRFDATERRAANDDRQSIGQLVNQLKRPPNFAPYWWAAGAALVWVIVGIGLAFAYHRGLVASSDGVESLLTSPALLGVFASILIPPMGFFGMAAVMRRSQDLELIARSMTDVALRLAQPETIATESVVSVGQAVRREVAAMTDGVDRAMTRASELEAMVRTEVSILERAYEENEIRIRSLVDDLQAERHSIQLETERLREGLAGAETILSEEVRLVSARINDTMLEASEQVTEILGQKGEHITTALARVGDSMIDSLTAKGGELIDRLQMTGAEIREDLSNSGDLLVKTLKSRTDDLAANLLSTTSDVAMLIDGWGLDVNGNLEHLKGRIGEALDEHARQLTGTISEHIGAAGETLRSTSDTIVADFSERGNELVRRLEDGSQKAAETLSTRGLELAEQIQTAGDRIYDAVVVRGESLPQRLAETGERITNSLDRSGVEITSALADKGNDIAVSLTTASTEMTERLSVVGAEVTKAIGARGGKVTDSFRETADLLSASIGTKGDAIQEALTSKLTAIEETITVHGKDLADRLHQEGTHLARTMQDGVKAFDATVKVHAPELVDQINLRVNSVNENLRLSVETLDQRLASTTSSVASTMDQRLARIEQTLDQRTQSFTETFASRTLAFARSIADGTRGTNEALERSVETIDSLFEVRTRALGEAMAEHAETANRTLGNRVQDVASMLDTRVARIEEQVFGRLIGMADTFETRSNTMAETLATRVEGVTGSLKSNAAEVERSLTSLSQNVATSLSTHAEKVSESLGERLNEIAHLIDDKNGAFLIALERTSQRAVSEITSTNTTLKGDVQSIIERLGEANSTFQAAMNAAVGNLGDFSGTFARQVDGFNQTVSQIGATVETSSQRFSSQIEDLKSLSNGALADVGGLADRLEQQGRLLGDAALALGSTHDRVEATLATRRANMEEMSSALISRVSDLENRLQNFHGMMDASFKSTQDRLRQIAGAVSEANTGSAKIFDGQFERVRHAADAERERTTAALRQTYEVAFKDMQRLFGETGSHFADAATELKKTAQDVQRSIELAREEMKRGILELPAETEASAATMRRAVAEQIKALAELNQIVARQGQTLDVVEASARSAAQAMVRSPAPAAPVRESRQRETLSADIARKPEMVADARATARTELKSETAPAADASEANLDVLASNVAHMVDQQVLADAWDRYLRGTGGSFSARLYSPQGRKAFETLRRRYREDAAFRSAADQSLGEFDRMLDKVSANDKNFVATKGHLTSEKGKAYTMLAHAVGRFD